MQGVKKTYKKIVNSIAFLPAVIAVLFLAFSLLMIFFDSSSAGKQIKTDMNWLRLKDASTARSICSSIAGGIISLAVFSFSLVMILLNQAASQMTNRILEKLISNRFQQVVLGCYIGTIVYALFLLSTIRDIDTGIYVPAFSTYLLIMLTIADIFLFIYFLHYITQAIKYETIILKITENTKRMMTKNMNNNGLTDKPIPKKNSIQYKAHSSGLYQGCDVKSLSLICEEYNTSAHIQYPIGTFILKGTHLITIETDQHLQEDFFTKMHSIVNIHPGQEIETNYYYGFIQLMEIAVKALSPGINDPGTAVISLHALGELLLLKCTLAESCIFTDTKLVPRVVINDKTFSDIFSECILPIWDYGKNDRMIQYEMVNLLSQLKNKVQDDDLMNALFITAKSAISNRILQ